MKKKQEHKQEAVLPEPSPLSPPEQRERERKRRRREMFFATLAFLVVLLLTSLQLDEFRAVDAIFVGVFQINFVLLIGIFLVVLRNGVKIMMERRRKVLGSRLRTRLVLAFVGFSLLPCLLMFFVTAKYVKLSMDVWFKDQIESSMNAALNLTSAMYEKIGMALVAQAKNIKIEAEAKTLPREKLDALMERKRNEYGNAFIGLYDRRGAESNWHGEAGSKSAWNVARSDFNWEQIERQGYGYTLASGSGQDYIVGICAVDANRREYLVLAYGMGQGYREGIDHIMRGNSEYRTLRAMKRPLQLMLYSSLGVLTALIILGAVWFGFRLARELSAPILALATGTDRIAKGDLSVRLPDSTQDEFGVLIHSFNLMAKDLEGSRQETTSAYNLLEEQNLKIARHSKYIETVLNNIAAGVVSFDHNGFISTVNHAACEILGLEAEAVLGKRVEDFMSDTHGAMAKAVRERFRTRLEARSQHSVSLTVAGEERRLLINVVGFSTEGVYRGAVAVFEDISELERMQRMAAWREVARRIAHEIKNPLTPIKLSAQRLARKFGEQVNNPAFTQGTELIVRQVEHLQALVQEFSAFAKLPEVNPKPGQLAPLLAMVTDIFRNSHSGIDWSLDIPQPLPELPMDKDALERVFVNIFANAAEVLQIAGTDHPEVRIGAYYHPALNLVRIDVADNGPGLTEEERARLFEPYFSRKKGGTGLGLTIVRSIVTDHRGYVRAQQRAGGGSIITVELPLA